MSPGATPSDCARAGRAQHSAPSRERNAAQALVLVRIGVSGGYDFDFFSTPTKLGPVSEPSSWRAKSTESPLQVTVTLLLSDFQVQCSISPLMVRSAFPPERSSSITLPARLL